MIRHEGYDGVVKQRQIDEGADDLLYQTVNVGYGGVVIPYNLLLKAANQ